MSAAHTPGPWTMGASTVSPDIVVGCKTHGIAKVYGVSIYDVEIPGEDAAETLANARLIAAAPELLGAAQAVVVAWESGDLAGTVRELAAAITKAKGGTS